MALFVIGDTHLGSGINKSMDLFGPRWKNHTQRLIAAWTKTVRPEDTVLVAGDISWAINLTEVVADLKILNELPGQKILLRGNHDYWWQSLSKIEELFVREGFETFKLLQNNAHYLPQEGVIVAGSRGWLMPSDKAATAHDKKIYKRELQRLENSLRAAQKIRQDLVKKGAGESPGLIAMLHYPPFTPALERSEVCEILEKYEVERVYYGHIHHVKSNYAICEEKIANIYYSLIAGDHLDFVPYKIPQREDEETKLMSRVKQESRPLASMTGYGRAQLRNEAGLLSCELRSVNHRYHELTCRMPAEFNSLEPEIRNLVKAQFSRGKIDLRIVLSEQPEAQIQIGVDQARLGAYLQAYKEIAQIVGQNELPTVQEVWRLPEVLSNCSSQDQAALEARESELRELLLPCLEAAMAEFRQSREREGEALRADILARLERLSELHAEIAKLAPSLVGQFKQRLINRIDELLANESSEYYPQQRVATEIAIYADKVAIDEELVRLKAHFDGARKTLAQGGVLGKKLDFLVQEMNREINTIASKANCLEITNSTMAMKNEVEKIREQLQNME
ncbi:MAG: YicC/YloC family endoribonuclease [Eubacteriales bacterium]|nr:YicC/YloC family endoribonuclease [Eubacteriales bacterium]